ncbi:unnamed protein product [Clonostachys solani]|uniref:Major facilitator superfamily (MFS) profile domain-containing protein n=1 Tax=Clonostachys solani TaxID=160281 RepID=A0A9N9ZFT9_9HYPO|nr:unnamed protein product [Clonostachys solani]
MASEVKSDVMDAKAKGTSSIVDEGAVPSVDIERTASLPTYLPGSALEKRLVRKLDFILLPMLWWMYILAYVDRGNVANANAAGLSTDLDLSEGDYTLVVSIFFIGYTIFEVPSNLLLNKFRPSRYLSTIVIVWGVCVAAMSQCKNRTEFLVGRFFLGCIEAGLFPGALYLLTCWYTKAEIGKRFAIFYTSGTIAPALGGIMAGAIISSLEGKLGWEGWRWLFLIEGVVTVFFGFIFYFILIEYPINTTKFFTKEECDLAYNRNLHDRQISVEHSKLRMTPWQSVKAVLADPRSWGFLCLYIIDSTCTSISYFIPVTLKAMGYTSITAQWMTVPIWVSGAVIMVIVCTSSDYLRNRNWHIFGCLTVGLICSIVCVTTTDPKPRYAMLCFYIGGIYAAVALILNWTSEEMALPDQKRSVALAFVNSWGNLSIIWGSRLWKTAENPVYNTGFTTTACLAALGAILAAALPFAFKYLPKEPMTKAERELLAAQQGQQRGQED